MRTYGYDASDPGKVDPAESAIFREIANRIVLGEPLMSIVRNLNNRGVMTAYGRPWDGATIRKMMNNKRICGGYIANRIAPIPALISEPLRDRVLEILARPERRVRLTDDHRTYVGTGWLRCARCGKVMPPKGGTPPSYSCLTRVPYKGCGRMRINSEPVDELIVAKVLARIARPSVRTAIVEAVSYEHGGMDRITALNDQIKKAIKASAEPETIQRMEADLETLVRDYEPVTHWGRWFATPANVTPVKLARWWIEADARRRQDLLSAILHHIDVLPVPRTSYATTARDRLEFVWLV